MASYPTTLMSDRKGLARHQLSLPIARLAITTQRSQSTPRPPSMGSSTVHDSPSPPSTATVASPPGPTLGSSPIPGSKTAAIQDSTPPNRPLRISSPRQPAVPKLDLQLIADISRQLLEPYSSPCHPSPTRTSCSKSSSDNCDCDVGCSVGSQRILLRQSSRRASWSPSQAIPEGYYSKGFTLTTFQRLSEKAHPGSGSSHSSHSTSHSSSFSSSSSSSAGSSHPSNNSSNISTSYPPLLESSSPSSVVTTNSSPPLNNSTVKRTHTNHPQRKPTLAPFRRFVNRSKSMKVKNIMPFITTNSDSDAAPVSERLSLFSTHRNNVKAANGSRDSVHSNGIKEKDKDRDRDSRDKDQNSNKNSSSSNKADRKTGGGIIIRHIITHNQPVATNYTTSQPSATVGNRNSNSDSDSDGAADLVSARGERGHMFDAATPKSALPTSQPAMSSPTNRPAIATLCSGPTKPLWQHTLTNAEEILAMGLTSQEIQKQETIFELIYTELEYLEDLKNIHRIFVEELNERMAEARRRKRFSPDKTDTKVFERLSRLVSHVKDLWNGHQSLLTSLQQRQAMHGPVIQKIGDVFIDESFYMFKIYDSYFAQYTPTSRDFQYIMSGSSELAMIIKDLLKSPRCKLLTLEGIFLKPIQRLQKYPLFFKDLMSMTSKSDPDYEFLERALHNHQTELMKIDDRIWIEGHNEMLKDLQHRIKGLPMNFSLVERHRYLVLDGPVYRVTTRQPSRPFARRHGVLHHSEGYTGLISPVSEWRDGIWSPASGGTDGDSHMPFHRPSQMDYHHLHSKPAYPASPSLSSSSSSSSSSKSSSTSSLTSSPYSPTTLVFPVSAPTTPKGLMTPRSKGGGDNPFDYLSRSALNSPKSPSSLYSATTLISLSSTNGATVVAPAAPQSIPNQSPKQTVSQLIASYNSQLSSSFSNFSSITGGSGGDGCNVGGGGGGGGLSGLRGFGGQPRNVSSSALYLPGLIKNTNDAEAEYHVFVFTDIILWTKRVMSSRYHRKEGTPWHFKLVEPVSRLTSVCNTNEDNIFMCTSVNTNSTSFLVRTEDEIAARMWKTTIPTLVRYHCSRSA